MVDKKMKRATMTITSLVVSLLVVIGLFTGMYLFLIDTASTADVPIDSKYSETYTKMQESQAKIDANMADIQNGIDSVTEADKNFFGLNGLKGLLAVLKAPLVFASTSKETIQALSYSTDEGVIPTWVKSLVYIGIGSVIIILIVAAMKGEPGSMK